MLAASSFLGKRIIEPSQMSDPLFHYCVRVSPRGRNVRLRVTVQRGLEVIVPPDYDTARVPTLLERKQHWIRAALERADSNRKFFEPEPTWKLPMQIKLPAVGQVWHVSTKETGVPWAAVREVGEGRLLAFGALNDKRECQAALGRWLMRQTREHLIPRLRELSQKTGLHYRRAYVRRPKTRWASCSRHRSISLNTKLLFLPPELVDYAMVHELCHVAEMNHSKRFWGLVKHHSPDFRKLDSRLRDMWKAVPRWGS